MTELIDAPFRNEEAHAAVDDLAAYKWGFVTDVESDLAPKGLTEDTVRYISAKKGEPGWLLDWRLKAYRHWLTMTPPDWAKLNIAPIDYQDAYYYAAPKAKATIGSLDELDPEIRRTYEKLGIPIAEQEMLAGVEGSRRIAVDAVFDSVSVATTFKKSSWPEKGIIFCGSISDAVHEFPGAGPKAYLGSASCSHRDNYFACAQQRGLHRRQLRATSPRASKLPDGAVDLLPHQCGQEHGAVRADPDRRRPRGPASATWRAAPPRMRDENQLHAAVVELVAMDNAEHQVFSTVQNWYPGDAKVTGQGRDLQLRHQARATARGSTAGGQLDAGGNRQRDHVEVPVSCVLTGDRQRRRVLLASR